MDVQLDGQCDGLSGRPHGTEEHHAPGYLVFAGDQNCVACLAELRQLGVTRFGCIIRIRCNDGTDVFTTTPRFKKGTRFSLRLLENAELLAVRLGYLIAGAVTQATAGTWADGYDLSVEAVVFVTYPVGPGGITARVTAISATDWDFEPRGIQLL